jgi:hypothetical protein
MSKHTKQKERRREAQRRLKDDLSNGFLFAGVIPGLVMIVDAAGDWPALAPLVPPDEVKEYEVDTLIPMSRGGKNASPAMEEMWFRLRIALAAVLGEEVFADVRDELEKELRNGFSIVDWVHDFSRDYREDICEVVRLYPGLLPFKDVQHLEAVYFLLDEEQN